MDYLNRWGMNRRTNYRVVTGTITDVSPLRNDQCSQFVAVVDEEGNETNFTVPSTAYIADSATMYDGMRAHFVYNADLPVALIQPPRYQAVAVVPTVLATNIAVGYFNDALINADNTLQLNLMGAVPVVTSNNQVYYGSPGGNYLLVMYERSTRSIPAQTTPERVVVMCEWR